MADERKSAIHLAKERAIIAQRVDQSKKSAAKRRQEREQEEKKTKCRTLNSQTEIFDLWGSQKEKTEVIFALFYCLYNNSRCSI